MSRASTWLDPRQTTWSSVDYIGVYVIWAPGTWLTSPTYLKAGQGDVRARVQNHLRDPRFEDFPNIRFTYAAISAVHRDGVERYLGDSLRPLFAERYPDVPPIPVVLPLVA